ncbi:MAG: hypothetical protein KKF56_03775 [Nanoarchaeota archaeon]|nr:hypothetical protein [Nanoarchaeota archaeon]
MIDRTEGINCEDTMSTGGFGGGGVFWEALNDLGRQGRVVVCGRNVSRVAYEQDKGVYDGMQRKYEEAVRKMVEASKAAAGARVIPTSLCRRSGTEYARQVARC